MFFQISSSQMRTRNNWLRSANAAAVPCRVVMVGSPKSLQKNFRQIFFGRNFRRFRILGIIIIFLFLIWSRSEKGGPRSILDNRVATKSRLQVLSFRIFRDRDGRDRKSRSPLLLDNFLPQKSQFLKMLFA